MLRAIWLTMQNEARLLVKDPMVLSMLLLAPVVIIAVAGYSLGNLYGAGAAGRTFRVPLVDHDHGDVAAGIIAALRREASIEIEVVADRDTARAIASRSERSPVAIEIPAGTTDAVVAGRSAQLVVYVDPVRRLEANAIELRLGELCREATRQAHARARKQLADSAADLHRKIERLTAAIKQHRAQLKGQFDRAQASIADSINAQVASALEDATRQAETLIRARENQAWADVKGQLAARQAVLLEVQRYLRDLQASQLAFQAWLAQLKTSAGSHAADIPPPPNFPAAPPEQELAELANPISPPSVDAPQPGALAPHRPSIKIPELPAVSDGKLLSDLEDAKIATAPVLPGDLGLAEQPAAPGGRVSANAFDQYVPGFGVTFLLIGMMLGVALTLFDERDWGTLQRLQVSGAPLAGVLVGKLVARFVVGIVQMTLLFAVGWALFGISLGREPLALLLPTAGISFAGAAFGLVIASVARAHDSVMPIGTMASMAMSAIGGCWWPLDFEPAWMRAVARWLPTTWAMQAYNDLMIRQLPPASALWPFLVAGALGAIYLAIGVFGFSTLKE